MGCGNRRDRSCADSGLRGDDLEKAAPCGLS